MNKKINGISIDISFEALYSMKYMIETLSCVGYFSCSSVGMEHAAANRMSLATMVEEQILASDTKENR
jgi:hypothetical protein